MILNSDVFRILNIVRTVKAIGTFELELNMFYNEIPISLWDLVLERLIEFEIYSVYLCVLILASQLAVLFRDVVKICVWSLNGICRAVGAFEMLA